MNSMQANEPRSATTGTEGGARLRRLVRRLSRRDATMLPMTLLLIGAASAAHELSGGDAKQNGSSNNDSERLKAPTDIEAQPGDKVAVLAGKTKIAEHVLTQEDIAAGKVRIALRAKGKAEVQEGAEEAAAVPANATKQAGEETEEQAEDRDDAGAILISDGAGAGSGGAAAPAAQQGDDDHSGVFWLFLGLGAVGAGVAIANHGDDDHKAPPTEEPPPPPPPPTQISGEVIKGYLQGAAVYLDTDHDGLPDGDPVYTDSQGRFTFTTDQTGASLLAFGGVDTLTNVPLEGLILRAPGGATVISPLTTLIDELMKQDDSLSVDAAQARLATALGLTLPGGVNLLSFDPIENLQNGGSSVEDQSEAVLNTISAIQSLLVGAGAADAVTAANAAITAMAQSMLDGEGALSLTSASDVAQVLEAAFAGTGVGASNAADLSQLAAAIAAVNSSLLEASGLSDAALQATRYALTGFQDLLTSVGAGARNSEQYDRDISFSNDSELAAAIESLATGGVESAIGEHIAASISYAQRLEGDRFVFALNPELKLYQGAPDKIDTVTVKFGDSGVVVERELRGANGAVSIEVISPAADGSYTFQYSELDKISIKPPADFNGVLSADISVHYAGLGVVESDTLGIAITSVNDAPVGQDSTVTTSENLTHVFSLADFPFTDARDGAYASGANELDAVKIVSLPQAGTLYLGETAITTQDVADGFHVSAADIAAGFLRFVPAAGENGAGYASFQFQVRDDGGTANGGVDLDPTARTLTINVESVNDAPTAGDSTVAIDEDTSHAFAPQDFNFTDVDGNNLATLLVTSLPEGGTLWHDGREITADDLGEHGYSISAADLANGLFRFVPDADTNGNVSFEFRVQDDGGTANGGSNTSATATFTFDIASVSDAPTSAGGSATLLEGDAHTFSLTDFDFNDVDGDALAAVLIDSLPAGGTLWHDDHQITLDDLGADGYAISAEDIALGLLRFVPDMNANGSISFDFRLQDDGGSEPSASATFAFEVTAVNDAPVATDSSTTVLEDGSHIFSASDFGFIDVEGDGLAAVIITSLPEGGTLWYGEDQLTLGDLGEDGYSISAADLAEGMLSFVPGTDSNDSASFQFRVQDDGGTANGGVDTGESATFTINVTPVNDAPVAVASSATLLEDGEHTFSAADFGFTDVEDDSLAAVLVTSLPEGGTLWHDGHELTLDDLGEDGYSIAAADLANGLLTFVPDANANGSMSFQFRVQDDGGTANGGADIGEAATFTINVTAVNDAPVATNGSATLLEDGEHTFSAADFGFTDIEDDDLAGLIITSLPEGGTLWHDGHELTLGDLGEDGYSVSATELANGLLTFVPDENANGSMSFQFRVQDDGGTANGGVDISEPATFTIDVTAVNDAPVATGSSATVLEDGEHTFSVSDFGFTDIEDDSVAAVLITSLPESGALWHGEYLLTLDDLSEGGYSISAADLADGLLTFAPDANANGSMSFQFRLQDDGGTDNGGVDISEPATFTIDVTAVSDAPVATGGSTTLLEDGSHTFSAADFSFDDVEDDGLASVIITSLPEGGALWHEGHELTLDDLGEDGYSIAAADLANGLLTFVPDANANGSMSFQFRVQDDGGTGNGGADISEPATFTINVTAVNDAPVATNGSAMLLEDGEHTFSAADFAFTDVDDDSLQQLIIDSLPTSGTLYFDGDALSLGDLGEDGYAISAEDLAAGKLVFQPDADANGTASFGFRVQDNGGVANDGADTSAQATFTLNVTAVNDAPTTTSGSTTIAEGGSYTFQVSDFSFSDPDGDELSLVLIDSLPGNGTLYFNDVALESSDVENGLQVTPAEIANGALRFEPAENQNGSADFSFRVRDVGGTGNGGADTSESATFTINITEVNDAPVASGNTLELDEGETVTFQVDDFSFTDVEGNSLAAVIITSLPGNGTLYHGEHALTIDDLGASGYSISATDLADGQLTFVPSAGYNGSIEIGYQVQDDGGTAVGGNDLSNEATLTLDISAVNDAPTLSLPDYATAVGPQAAGAFFPVNTFTAGGQENPSIAALADGGFVVAWISKGQDSDDNSYGVYAQRFDASGAKVGGEIQVNQTVAGDQFDPMVIATPNGEFVVVWSSIDDVGGANLHSRAFDADGVPLHSEGNMGPTVPGDQFQPAAAIGVHGAIVTWTSDGQDGSGFGIYGQVSYGENSTGEFRINTTTAFDQFASQVVALADGSYVVSWTGNDETNSKGIFAQRVSATGDLLGAEFRVNAATEGEQVEPAIAALSDGGFVITWTATDESGKGVYLQRYDAAGVALGEQLLVNTNQENDQFESAVTALPTGGFVVTWTSWGSVDSTLDIYAQRFGVDGEPLSAAVLVNSYTTYEQTSPAITVLNDGGIVVTWQSNLQDGSGYGIYGQRFEPFAPNFIEGGAAVLIAPMATVADAELDALNNGDGDWSGASITIGRAGEDGAVAFESSDSIDFMAGNGYAIHGEDSVLTKDGQVIATYTVDDGVLVIRFGGESATVVPTTADVNYILQHFTYASSSNDLSAGSVKFHYSVDDGNSDGSQGSGGTGTAEGTVTVQLTDINDAPVASSNSVTLTEDGTHTFSSSDFSFTDAEGHSLQALIITALPEHGTLTLNGNAVGLNDAISASDLGSLVYTPNGDYNGSDSFGYQLRDDGGTVRGGSDTSSTATMSITVNAVNDAPTLDLSAVASFDFVVNTLDDVVDPNDGLISLREAIAMALDGQTISFSEELLANGPVVINLTETLHITKAIYINGAPAGGEAQVELHTDGSFSAIHANVSSPGGAILEGIIISGDPSERAVLDWDYEPAVYNEGTLTLADVTIKDYHQESSRAFGTAISALLNTGTLYVSNVLIDNNVSKGWDATDSNPGSAAYIIFNSGAIHATDFHIENNTAVGGNGTVASAGAAHIYVNVGTTLGTPIMGADDDANEVQAATNNYAQTGTATEWSNSNPIPPNPPFVYQPPVIESTSSVAYIEGASGVQLAPTATLADPDLDGLNDGAGDWSGASITLQRSGSANSEDTFGFVDANDLRFAGGNIYKSVGGSEHVIGTYTSMGGVLTVAFVAAGSIVATSADADHVLQQITYSNSSNDPESSVELTYTVSDGNSGTQGPDGALTASGTLTVNITSVNDAPTTSDGSLMVSEDGSTTFSSSDFPFSDVDGGSLDAVIVTSLPEHGTLTLNGNAVSVNDAIPVGQLGSLVYTPNGNYSGSDSFGYQVRDNGGTGNGGSNTSSSATMSITVNAVNDAPALDLPVSSEYTFVVDTLEDVVADDGKLSLREAIALAKNGDSITFSESILTEGFGSIELASTLVIDKQIYINGAAAGGRITLQHGGFDGSAVSVTADVGDSKGGAVLQGLGIEGSTAISLTQWPEPTAAGISNLGHLTLHDIEVNNLTVTSNTNGTAAISALYNGPDAVLQATEISINDNVVTGRAASGGTSGTNAMLIYNYAGEMTIDGLSMLNNTLTGGGGSEFANGSAIGLLNYGGLWLGSYDDGGGSNTLTDGGPGGWTSVISDDGWGGPAVGVEFTPPALGDGATASYTEGASAVQLAPNATLSDPDLDALNGGTGDWTGASIVVRRSGDASSDDTFGLVDGNDLRFSGGLIYKMEGEDETVIGTYSSVNGAFTIDFIQGDGSVVATSADADHVLQQITYSNSSKNPEASVELTYTVDDGNSGTQGPGESLTATGTLTVNITAVNDASETTAKIVTINEDQGYTFGTSDFGFTDAEGDSLAAVVINSLPTDGTLYFDGNAITSDQLTSGYEVSAADLTAGKLTFMPNENYYGSTNFSFSVRDNGGTASGGEDTSESATFTFDMRSVNDAPMLDLPASPAYDYVVTTLADIVDGEDGVLSLREALALAQDGQTIGFSASILEAGAGTILLGSALTIGTAVYIDGASAGGKVTLQHTGAFDGAMINVTSDVGGDGAVLQGLALGRLVPWTFVADSDDAGGIVNHGVLTLADFTIQDLNVNVSSGSTPSTLIGAIYNAVGATLNASNLEFTNLTVWGMDNEDSGNGGEAALVFNDGTMNLNGVNLAGSAVHGGDGGGSTGNGGNAYYFINIGTLTGYDSVVYAGSNYTDPGYGSGEGYVGEGHDYLSEQPLSGDPVFTFTPRQVGDGTPSASYSTEGEPVLLAPEASLHDVELDALNGGNGNWSGATITVQRQGGANSNDVFGHQMPYGFMPPALVWTDNGTITKNGHVIATYSNTGGQLQLHFTGFGSNIPTTADVNELLRQITYSTTQPQAEVVIEYRVSDGNASFHGLQGSGGEGVVTGTVTVHMDVPPLGTPTSVSLIESELAGAKGDGNTNEYVLTYRVDLPESGIHEGSEVQLFKRGTDDPIATHIVTGEDIAQGWVSLQPVLPLGEGTHAISARLADASDTQHSELTAPFFTVVDHTVPDAPVLDFESLSVREDDAQSGFVLSGSAEAFATVEVLLAAPGHDPQAYRATAGADGRFQVAVDPTLFGDERDISITAVVKDRAENASIGATATLTIIDADPATAVSGTAGEDEVFAGISGDAVVFEPGHNGGNDYFIGSTSAFDTVRIAGNSANYTITLVEGAARDADQTILQGQGHELLAGQPLYLIRGWHGTDTTELRVQADAIQFDDAMVRLTDDGIVGSPWSDSLSGVTLHDDVGNEHVTGSQWHDTLFSHDGDDWLDGGSGNDTLVTVGGHDTLVGGDGDDLLVVFGDGVSAGEDNEVELYGGLGQDVFMIAPQTGFDRHVTIHDFVIGEDKIDLSRLRIEGGGTSQELTLENLDLEQLNSELHANGVAMIDLGQFLTADSDTSIGGTLMVRLAGGASTLTASDFILEASHSSLPDYQLLMLQAYLQEPV